MNGLVTVSVIIPTWNRAVTLEKAVRSALVQTHSPLEVLVCDDGSTDDTERVVSSMNDNRLVWLPGEHSGRPAIPRNRGIKRSRGEWLAFLDDDDEWLPEKLEKQIALANKLGCNAVCSNAYRFVPEQGIVGSLISWDCHKITYDDLLNDNQIICSSALVHRSLLASVQCFPENEQLIALEDYAFWLRVAVFTDFAFVNSPLLYYRDNAVSSIRNNAPDVRQQFRIAFENFTTWGIENIIEERYLLKVSRRLNRKLSLNMFNDFLKNLTSRKIKPQK